MGYHCYTDVMRVFDEDRRVDLLTNVCGIFEEKPITTCSNKIVVQFSIPYNSDIWYVDATNVPNVSSIK